MSLYKHNEELHITAFLYDYHKEPKCNESPGYFRGLLLPIAKQYAKNQYPNNGLLDHQPDSLTMWI